jgi:hypothetical protein
MNPSDHRSMRLTHAAAIVCCLGAASLGAACDAELEPGCIDGTCTGATTGSGDGPCAGDEHDLPCGVYEILSNICQNCHVPGGMGPFTLLDYCDTQEERGSATTKKPIWVRMQDAIQVDAFPRMPLNGDPLSDTDMATMNEWFATCGSNVEPYDYGVCAGAQFGPPPSCEGGAGGGGAGPVGGAGGAPAGGAGGAGGTQ